MWTIILYIVIGIVAFILLMFGLLLLISWMSRIQMRGWLEELDNHLGIVKYINTKKEKENGTEKEK